MGLATEMTGDHKGVERESSHVWSSRGGGGGLDCTYYLRIVTLWDKPPNDVSLVACAKAIGANGCQKNILYNLYGREAW